MDTQAEIDANPSIESQPVVPYFSSGMPPVRLPLGYQVGIILVALVSILLPVIYLGFIAGVGWGMYFWATHALNWLFPVVGGRRHIFWFLGIVYILPLFIGLVLLAFMLKNFFSRWQVANFSAPISHTDHPEIFHFLGQLCQCMGAPIPSRVDVTLELGASAGFRSFFANDIQLTFGLPLVAGMNCREFAALVAHELGHFTQRSAMRFNFVIRSVHGWLARAVYDSGDFESSLADAGSESGIGFVISAFSWFAVAFTRGIMWILLTFSHALTSFLSRQMEIHADACATAVAGTGSFVSMFNKLRVLTTCYAQFKNEYKNRVLPRAPDDLSTYIAMLASQCSGEKQGKILQSAAVGKASWFDSHPAYAERIQRALQAQQPGLISDDRPAMALFANFPELSRSLTLAGYQMLRGGVPVSENQLFHVEAAKAQEDVPDTSAEEELIHHYFGGLGLFLRPVLLSEQSALSTELALPRPEQLQQAKLALQHPDLPKFADCLNSLDAQMLQALQANALLEAGVHAPSEQFTLLDLVRSDPSACLASIQAQQDQLGHDLEPFEKAARVRLMTALNLLRTPAVAARIPDSVRLNDEVQDLLHVSGKLSAIFPLLLELRKEYAVLQALLDARNHAATAVQAASTEYMQRCNNLLSEIQTTLGSAAYPFEHPKGHISIADYARTKQYHPEPALMTQLEAASHLRMIIALYHRVLSRLIAIALQVEQQLEKG